MTRVRQALFYGLDRESIVNDILLGYAEVAQGTQPVISYAYAPDGITTKYTFDPEKAKALLAEAGWTDSDGDGIVEKDGKPFSFEMHLPLRRRRRPTRSSPTCRMPGGRSVSSMTPRAMEFSALVEDHHRRPQLRDGDARLQLECHASSRTPCSAATSTRAASTWSSTATSEVDELNAQAKRTFDEEARRELMIEATNIVNEELPVAVMHFSKAIIGYSDRLQNFKPSSWGVDTSSYVWIQQ